MGDYIKPQINQIPFRFGTGGYSKPDFSNIPFNFRTRPSYAQTGDMKATINVFGIYQDTTYTYLKYCERYIVGYSPYGIQILKGKCYYGGIRDFGASIVGITKVVQTRDLSGYIKSVREGVLDLSLNISMHLPGTINCIIKSVYSVAANLSTAISTHLPVDINSIIKPLYHVVVNLPGSIYGWQKLDLYANILMHPPKDLEVSVFVKRASYADLDIFIHAWHIKDLQIRLDRVIPFDLSATIDLIQPVDLSAYLKVRYAVDLKGSLKGWCIKNLSGAINSVFANDLNVKIYGRDDMFKNLYFRIKGQAIEIQSLLSATIRGFIGKDLSAVLIATYLSNLSGYLLPVLPKDISASIHAWHISDLQIILNGQRGPWDLSASIISNTNLRTLTATINSMVGTNVLSNLPMNIHSWKTVGLTSSISLIEAENLRATLIPYMYAKDLHASIYPKMIRLSAIINVATMEHRDLSAMINSFCIFTGYKNLSASLSSIYKSDLLAYIRALKYSYKPSLLGATVGYTDTITEVDKYKLSVNILPNEMRTFDRYMISFNVFNAAKYLSAYIKGIMCSSSLTATIIVEAMDSYDFGRIKTIEEVVHLTYNGMFETFETVETSFKSLVKDYYYSSDGDFAWKTNRLDRWILEIKSFLPINSSLKLKRRLHKETQLYDLKRFSDIDEAMRFAITYVTEYPRSDLSTSIFGRGRYSSLGATISPRYVKEDGASLSGTLTPIIPTIVVGTEQGNIVKI